jgi:excisionase family DNA binding protein
MAKPELPSESADVQAASSPCVTLAPDLLAAIEAAARAVCYRTGGAEQADSRLERYDHRLAYSIEQLAKLTSLGRQFIYDEISAGRLVARKKGRRTVILRSEAEGWLAAAPTIEASTASADPNPVATPTNRSEPPKRSSLREPHDIHRAKHIDTQNATGRGCPPARGYGQNQTKARQNASQKILEKLAHDRTRPAAETRSTVRTKPPSVGDDL